jgi:signal transduction histidine kinase
MNVMVQLMKQPKWLLVVLSVMLVLVLGFIDYHTGPQISFSLFYLLPISLITCAMGGSAGVLLSIASAASWLVADLLWDVPYSSPVIPYWNAFMRLIGFLLVVYLLSAMRTIKEDLEKIVRERTAALTEELAERKRAEEEIRTSHEQLRQLAANIEAAREEERTAVAREIHDELGQALTGLRIDLSWLESKLSQEEIRTKIEEMKESTDSMLKVAKKISAQLRPAVLDHLGLVAAVEWQTREFQKRTGIRSTFTSNVDDVSLDENRTTAVYRIYLEALTNVARHASASELGVNLKQEDNALNLKVSDNGRGITDGEILSTRSIGLLGMKERASLLGGKVDVRGSPGTGTMLTLTMPLNGLVGNHDQGADR